MGHQSRIRKKFNVFEPDPSAPDIAKWLKIIGAVNRCGEEMEGLLKKYGAEVFLVNATIFLENAPEKMIFQVERYRYLNSRLQDGTLSKRGRMFIPPVDPRKDG
jgi:hypothetical protein